MMKKVMLSLWLILCSNMAFADNKIVQSVIDSFMDCDNSFFSQLQANATDFDEYTTLNIQNNVAYIPVKNANTNDDNSVVYFKKPIQYRGLEIIGYQDSFFNTAFSGKYYFWGFIVNQSVKEIKLALPQLPWRALKEDAFIANSKLFDHQYKKQGWQNHPYIIDGALPRLQTAEKFLLTESIDEHKSQLLCTIQGDFNADILYAIRPDMVFIEKQLEAEWKAKFEELKLKKEQEEALSNIIQPYIKNEVTEQNQSDAENSSDENQTEKLPVITNDEANIIEPEANIIKEANADNANNEALFDVKEALDNVKKLQDESLNENVAESVNTEVQQEVQQELSSESKSSQIEKIKQSPQYIINAILTGEVI